MKTTKNLFIVPILTVLVGFASFILLSIYYNVFWFTSEYDVPLIYNVSVMLGDSIILPLINYKIFNLSINTLGLNSISLHKRKILVYSLLMFVISLAINIFAHIVWVNDQLTDFVGFKQGEFSIIGYWHLVYSILQMLVLLIFPYIWYIAIKEKNVLAIKYAHNIWKFLLLFSTLAIFDMLNKYFFIYTDKTIFEAIQIDVFVFSTVLLSFILLYIMKHIEKANEIHL